MVFLSIAEAQHWATGRGFVLDPSARPIERLTERSICIKLSDLAWTQLPWFSGFVATTMQPFDQCLLWVTEWGVWPSNENWHLFYRLCEGYGERRLLSDAPGHLFLKHELADLATFVQLSLLSGWDFHVLPAPTFASVFASHNEFLHLHFENHEAAQAVMRSLDDAKVAHKAAAHERG